MSEKKYDLEDRFIKFAVDVIQTAKAANWTDYATKYYQQQLIRASGSVSPNFSEFIGAATEKDKLNKLTLSLKEARECRNNLAIQLGASLNQKELIEKLHTESTELIKILKSIINNRSR